MEKYTPTVSKNKHFVNNCEYIIVFTLSTKTYLLLIYIFFFVAEFATLQWSPDETKIVYIAEKKVVKSEPFYKQKPKTSGSKDGADNSIIPVN